VNTHIARQLVRSATSPAANYAEACAAPSRKGFVYRLRVCLQELRETRVWLALLTRCDATIPTPGLEQECNELLAILTRSITTAERGKQGPATQ
jgi:four helix bundle protein